MALWRVWIEQGDDVLSEWEVENPNRSHVFNQAERIQAYRQLPGRVHVERVSIEEKALPDAVRPSPDAHNG